MKRQSAYSPVSTVEKGLPGEDEREEKGSGASNRDDKGLDHAVRCWDRGKYWRYLCVLWAVYMITVALTYAIIRDNTAGPDADDKREVFVGDDDVAIARLFAAWCLVCAACVIFAPLEQINFECECAKQFTSKQQTNLNRMCTILIFMTAALGTVLLFKPISDDVDEPGSFPGWAIAMISIIFAVLIVFQLHGAYKAPHSEFDWRKALRALFMDLLRFLTISVLILCLFIWLDIFMHWYKLSGGAENMSEFDPHHWQYGAIGSCWLCFAATKSATGGSSSVNRILYIVIGFIIVLTKGVLFGVFAHGLMSYGPDSAMRRDGKWHVAVPISSGCYCLLFGLACCYVYRRR